MTRFARKIEEALVFADDAGRKHMTPSLFARQAAGEGERRARFIEHEVLDALTKVK